MRKTKTWLAAVVMLMALMIMQTQPLGAQSQNFNQVQKTAGAAGVAYGVGATLCTVLTSGGCGVGLVIGGVVMGTIAVAAGYPPTPDDWRLPTPDVSEMPDYCDMDCDGSGGNTSADGGLRTWQQPD